MKITPGVLAVIAICLLTSLSAFSQEVIQPSDKSVAANEVKATPESTDTVKPKTEETAATPIKPKVEETKTAPVKRQSTDSDSWKGFYLGGNVGGTVANHSLVTSTAFCGGFNVAGCYFAQSSVDLVNRAGNREANPKGFTSGVQAGYNFQSGNFVAGVEADFNSARQNQTVSGRDTYTSVTPGFPFQVTQTIKTDWLMTVRPRAGFTAGKAFIYGTGGLAVTNINYQMNFEDFPPTGSGFTKGFASKTIKETKAGWTAGAGAEFKINDNWSVKGEYLYTQFNTTGTNNNFSDVFNNGTPTLRPNQIFTSDVKLKSNNFRFGFNYRF